VEDPDPPEPVAEFAALWRRVLARAIDYTAMFWWLFALQVLQVTTWLVDDMVVALLTLAAFYAVLEIVYVAKRGQTPGKELLKIRVVREGKPGPPGWQFAIGRWALPGLVLALPVWLIPVGLAVLGAPALFDPRRRTLYDRLFGSIVVPYDARQVEGEVRSRRNLMRNGMDRQVAALAGRPELMKDTPGDNGAAEPGTRR
jgi:uncharacterized RDD family membrane protein YckC